MDNRKKCTLCKEIFESDDAAVLTMSGFGNARYVCPECERLMDEATTAKTHGEITEAIAALCTRADLDTADSIAFESFNEIISGAKERAEKIKNGEYDFALDCEEEGFEEIPEELRETEEDRALDEKDAKTNALFDKISSWVCGGLMAGIVIYFLITLIF